jgi:hypothetical protein
MSIPTNDWTYCTLWVTPATTSTKKSQLEEMKRLKEELVDTDGSALSFNNHVPIPHELIDAYGKDNNDTQGLWEKTGYHYLHEFTYKEWGTPYDADDVRYSEDDSNNIITYEFRTINGCPVAWLMELSIEFPSLMFDLECTNEMDLFDSYTITVLDGEQIDIEYHKKQK